MFPGFQSIPDAGGVKRARAVNLARTCLPAKGFGHHPVAMGLSREVGAGGPSGPGALLSILALTGHTLLSSHLALCAFLAFAPFSCSAVPSAWSVLPSPLFRSRSCCFFQAQRKGVVPPGHSVFPLELISSSPQSCLCLQYCPHCIKGGNGCFKRVSNVAPSHS